MHHTFAGKGIAAWAAIVLAGLSVLPAATEAGGMAHAVMLVSATVQPSAVFKFEVRTPNISISSADIKRGYIEVAAGSLLSVNAGKLVPIVVVDFAPQEGAFKSVEVRTERGWRVAAGGADNEALWKGLNSLPSTALGKPDIAKKGVDKRALKALVKSGDENNLTALTYRFNLSYKARPGNYPVPLILNITL
jgi:hypothetical protein